MRQWAFVISIVGMFVLILLFLRSGVVVEDYEGLSDLEVNTKVVFSGKVISERVLSGGKTRIMEIEKNITAVCDCDRGFKGKNVKIEGIVEEFNGEKQVRVLRIGVVD